jgi:hypothetical protein
MESTTYDDTNLGSAVSTKEQKFAGASLISPAEHPLYSSLNKVSLKSTTQSWFLDDYSPPRTTPVAEGTNPSTYEDANEFIGEVFNYTHTLERTGQQTDDFMLTDSYVDTSLARAKQKKSTEIFRDVEKLLFDETARSNGSKGGTPRRTEGLAGQLTRTSSVFSDAPEYLIPTSQVITASAPTETTVNDALKSVADNSGSMADLVVYADSGWMHEFTKNVLRTDAATEADKLRVNIDGSSATVGLRLKVYDGISGKVTLVMTNPLCSRDTTNLDTALFLNRKNVKIGHLGANISINDEPVRHGTKEFSIRTKAMPMVTNPKSCVNWQSTS